MYLWPSPNLEGMKHLLSLALTGYRLQQALNEDNEVVFLREESSGGIFRFLIIQMDSAAIEPICVLNPE